MKLISRLRDHRYCAFCRSKRRLYVKKHVDLTNVVALVAVCLAGTQAVWDGPDPRGLVLFCVLAAGAEMFIYLRWRGSVVCRMCGFDPILYKQSPERAAQKVNRFFREQSENPAFWLSSSPLLDLHRRLTADERRREDLARARERVRSPDGALSPSKTARRSPAPSP